ncbi:hypothetical protein PsAD46_00981 [Pseudovibrio sp. Ad46]|nr:hypothetical protein PsAD46_00981 [Pseudovibrio sp. Ad46]
MTRMYGYRDRQDIPGHVPDKDKMSRSGGGHRTPHRGVSGVRQPHRLCGAVRVLPTNAQYGYATSHALVTDRFEIA